MTAFEKARELLDKMDNVVGGGNYDAKQYALICVDELIESHLLLTTTHDREPSIRCKRYWQEVKEELIKL
jgi:hypothetical protein